MKTIKKYLAIVAIIIINVQCQSQVVTLDGIKFINMPFKQSDFDNKDVIYKIACSGSDLNNDGRKDIVIILDYSDSKFEDSSIAGIINNTTLICTQDSFGNYVVSSYDLRILFNFSSTEIECKTGSFIITIQGDRYDDYFYTMEFQNIDGTFYLIRKKVTVKVETVPLEDVQITDKSQPIDSFNLMKFFYEPYLRKRDLFYNSQNKD